MKNISPYINNVALKHKFNIMKDMRMNILHEIEDAISYDIRYCIDSAILLNVKIAIDENISNENTLGTNKLLFVNK